MRCLYLLVFGLTLLFAPVVSSAAPPLPPGVTRITATEGITEYRLTNGLQVLLFPDLSKPTITVNITYKVGSRHENYGETGMAHLLEHLLFKGTPKNPNPDQQISQRGARYNGTTSLDRTNYYEMVSATDDNLRWAIELEADRMVHAFVRKSDLSSEMTVVRNEFEKDENAPYSVFLKRLRSVAYDWHSYGRAVIGSRSDIENVKEENLRAFYRQYYQPDNAVLLVAGKFDEARALSLIAGAFNPIPKPVRALPEFWTVEPTQDGEREFRIRRKGDLQFVAVAYKVPARLHGDSDAIAVADYVLGDVPTGRLHKELVETGKAVQVFSSGLTGAMPGLQLFGAVVKLGQPLEPVHKELVRIVESFGSAPPTAQEVTRVRRILDNQFELTLNDPESIGLQISEYVALGDWRLFFQSRAALARVTATQVQQAARAYFRRDNRTTGYFIPEDAPQRAEIPKAPTAAEVLKDFVPNFTTSVAESFDPSQANIDARTKRFILGGLKVALLVKKTRGESVQVSLDLDLGNEQSLFGKRTIAQFTGQLLTRGTTRFSRTQLADEIDRLKIAGSLGSTGAVFQTTRPNLEEALRLAAHVLKEPTFPESEFSQLKQLNVTSIESQFAEPEARASEVMEQHFNLYPKGDCRYTPTLAESLAAAQAVTLEDVKRFHREFYGASAAEIAVVGDFDEEKVTAVLKELFASWKSPTPYVRASTRYADIAAVNRTVQTADKENAILLARQNLDVHLDAPDYPALYVANYIFGGSTGFDSRLGTRLRQKEGLSYGVNSGLSVPYFDRSGSWWVYAIAAPQKIAQLEAALREELARVLKDGITQSELTDAKSGVLQQRLQNRAQDSILASSWALNLFYGRTYEFSKAFEDKLKVLSVADVNAALRKYLNPDKLTVVKAGDFTKK